MNRFRSYAVSHPGAVRTHNEDNYVDRPDIGRWAPAGTRLGKSRRE